MPRNRPDRPKPAVSRRSVEGPGWIWGRHAVLAAIANPRRKILSLYLTGNAARDVPDEAAAQAVIESPAAISARLPGEAVHQGFAAKAQALLPEALSAVAEPTHGTLLVLDQITDPHNAGALFRSAAAFGVRAVVMQDRKAPPLFGALCKAAVGAAETVSHVRVVNIAEALTALREAGRTVIGLAGEAELSLEAAIAVAPAGPGLVFVLGAEDKGLRPKVAGACTALARIPIFPAAESLNVSNAAAIALYEAARRDPRLPRGRA